MTSGMRMKPLARMRSACQPPEPSRARAKPRLDLLPVLPLALEHRAEHPAERVQ